MTDRQTIRVYIQGYAGVGKTTLAAILLKHLTPKFGGTVTLQNPDGDSAVKLHWLNTKKIDPKTIFQNVDLEIREVHAQAPLVGVPGERVFTLAQIQEAYEAVNPQGQHEPAAEVDRFLFTLQSRAKKV